jgi:hypothetical protein
MTERFEITSILQRQLVNDPALFGTLQQGTADNPGIRASSIHHIMKLVAGVPLRRPVWFFDTVEYGEGLADVGTHVVDIAHWIAFPDQILDYRKDVQMISGRHWPTKISTAQFQQVTGEKQFPASLAANVHDGSFDYFCNNAVHYTIKGTHVQFDILWNLESKEGGDVYEAVFRGSNANIEIRQGKAEKFQPQIYVVPQGNRATTVDALRKRIAAMQTSWPGVGFEEAGTALRITIPEKYHVGHESHFAQVTNRFFHYLKEPQTLPAWEKSAMLVKYYVSTKGVELGQGSK